MKATQLTPITRRTLMERCAGVCEKCGHQKATEAHHRKPRGMGGTMLTDKHQLSNLLALCTTCHAWIESERNKARMLNLGWLVDQHQDPRVIPALLYNPNHWGPARFLLHDDGTLTLWDDTTAARDGAA